MLVVARLRICFIFFPWQEYASMVLLLRDTGVLVCLKSLRSDLNWVSRCCRLFVIYFIAIDMHVICDFFIPSFMTAKHAWGNFVILLLMAFHYKAILNMKWIFEIYNNIYNIVQYANCFFLQLNISQLCRRYIIIYKRLSIPGYI